MIQQLAAITAPGWLKNLSRADIESGPFPLSGILRDSLYYPSSGLDGVPVKRLAGNILSFIHVDYGYSRDEFIAELKETGFLGYDIVGVREISRHELVPNVRLPPLPNQVDSTASFPDLITGPLGYDITGFLGYDIAGMRYIARHELAPNRWRPSLPTKADFTAACPDSIRENLINIKPFCVWSVLQRREEYPDSHGPSRFSFLYICADGVAAFQALYIANHAFPKAVAIIQPGHGFGGNWTNFGDPDQIFARTVLGNPWGQPELLMLGGCSWRARWPGYQTHIASFGAENGYGYSYILWSRSQDSLSVAQQA